MKPSRFEYFAPSTLEECVELLGRYGDDAKVLAGGQSLVPLMNLRLAAPEVLIDINRVDGLSFVRREDDVLVFGATTSHHEVATSELVRGDLPMLAEAAGHIGYPAIRYRGTIGGSLAHADPVSEIPCVAVALDAELVAVSSRGRRTIPATEFFVSYFTSALRADELLVEIRFARTPAVARWAFVEFARKSGDFAVAAVAAELRLDGDGVASARIGLGGIGGTPLRALAAEEILVGRSLDEQQIVAAGASVAELVGSFDISEDLDRDYRPHVARTLTERALRRAIENGGASR